MNENRILYSDCIRIYQVEENFIDSLQESGLIHIVSENEQKYIEYDDMDDLEQFVRWRYDWDINIEGIEAMHHLLGKVRALQAEVERLQNELDFYKKIF